MSDAAQHDNARRFLAPHAHLASAFGGDWFGSKAEAFAKFFGTPTFLIGQTIIVAAWIVVNVLGWTQFDVYPFILLNLAFSLQAAYAAPMILLAQTRQADRDNAHAIADAQHREEIHKISEQRQEQVRQQTELMVQMLDANTKLTNDVKSLLDRNNEMTAAIQDLVQRVETLTSDVHDKMGCAPKDNAPKAVAQDPSAA